MALLDAGGNVLASASSVAGGLSVLLDQIAIPADGTYFIRLTGASAASYALSLLANSAIDAEPNNTLATAQDISKTGAAFGNISGNDDYYAINVPAADGIITLQTWTPSDGAGYYTNGLNPTIALYDPTGKLVASDDNSAGDGHNALLVRSVSAGGRYVVRVYGGAGAGVSGEYVLRTSYRLQGDVNGDRTVDTADFVILLRHYGQHNPPFADGDLNGDGEVGFVDFQIFERAFGQTIVTPLPVPATIPLQMNASSKKTSSFFSEIPIKPKPITPVAKPSPPPKRLSLRR
jgi:hypothetical protein